MKNQLKELAEVTCRIEGNHPDGSKYTHSSGTITDIWEPNPGYIGFRFKVNDGSGYTWPGINRIELTDSGCKCFYTNVFDQVGYAKIIKE